MFKIAMVGLSQKSFAGEKESRYQKSASAFRTFLQPLNAELYVYPKQVVTPENAYEAVGAIQAEQADFLLVQCTTFSAGHLAEIFANAGFPLGFWAVPETTTHGPILYNSLCSINMYGSIVMNYLHHRRIPFKWFFGEVEDDMFCKRMCITVRALKAIKSLCNSSVALVGGIAPGFNDLYFDERKLLARFPGMKFNRLHEFSELAELAFSYSDSEVEDVANALDSGARKGIDKHAAKHHMTNARFLKAYRKFVRDNHYDALAVSCWPKFQSQYDYSACSVVAQMNDDGVPAACEGDVPSAVSMLLLNRLTSMETTLMDMSAIDETDETVLMWHCGPTASCFANRDGYLLGLNYSGKAHIEGEPPTGCGVTRDMVFKPMTVTVGHIAGECDELLVAGGAFADHDKPSYCGSRGWMGNLSIAGQQTGARDFLSTILDRGLSHHFPIAQGSVQDELMEIAAWLDLKVIEKIPYTHAMKNFFPAQR